jgi:hypothetical protein
MTKRIALVHAVIAAMQPIADAFQHLWPAAECVNILDDSLSRDREKSPDLTPHLHQRFDLLADYAARIGADGLLFTCSAFGEAIERIARRTRFPVLKPNEAMYEAALAYGTRIGMLATFAPAVAGMAQEFDELAKSQGTTAELRTICIPEAMEALRQGDVATHNSLLANAAPQLKDCDVVMLAHFSTSRAEKAVSGQLAIPVLTSPSAAVRKLRTALGA